MLCGEINKIEIEKFLIFWCEILQFVKTRKIKCNEEKVIVSSRSMVNVFER